jgi:hypothetical protein
MEDKKKETTNTIIYPNNVEHKINIIIPRREKQNGKENSR